MKNYIYTNHNKDKNDLISIWWLKWFMPKIYLKHYSELNVKLLKTLSIKIIISDLDNTLVPYYKNIPSYDSIRFVKNIQAHGIKFIVVSNNFHNRVKNFSSKIGANECYPFAHKPFSMIIKKICKKYSVSRNEIVVMGDQLLTDVLMANLFGCVSVLILPLLNEDRNSLKIVRYLNNLLYKKLSANHLLRFSNFNKTSENLNINNDWL